MQFEMIVKRAFGAVLTYGEEGESQASAQNVQMRVANTREEQYVGTFKMVNN